MKASRPTKVITNASPPPTAGWAGLLRRHTNNLLTLLLVIAAIVMLVRWRMQTSANAKIAIGNELATAQQQLTQLEGTLMSGAPGPDQQKTITQHQNAAIQAISNVLNSSDADAKLRAQALITKGDLYWSLGNVPVVQRLKLSDSTAAFLQKAWEAYQEVVKNSTYADQHESLAIAHLGLAAIAENRAASDSGAAEWTTAKQEFEAVLNDPNALDVLATAAKNQLAMIPTLQTTKYYLAPVVNTPEVVPMPATTQSSTMPSTLPALLPMGPMLPANFPATLPAGLPAKMPTTLPTTLPSVKMPPVKMPPVKMPPVKMPPMKMPATRPSAATMPAKK